MSDKIISYVRLNNIHSGMVTGKVDKFGRYLYCGDTVRVSHNIDGIENDFESTIQIMNGSYGFHLTKGGFLNLIEVSSQFLERVNHGE